MSENKKKSIKIVNIDGENLHIFWTTWVISMKLSGMMHLTIILKVTKNQDFTTLYGNHIFEKTTGGVKLTPLRTFKA